MTDRIEDLIEFREQPDGSVTVHPKTFGLVPNPNSLEAALLLKLRELEREVAELRSHTHWHDANGGLVRPASQPVIRVEPQPGGSGRSQGEPE